MLIFLFFELCKENFHTLVSKLRALTLDLYRVHLQ